MKRRRGDRTREGLRQMQLTSLRQPATASRSFEVINKQGEELLRSREWEAPPTRRRVQGVLHPGSPDSGLPGFVGFFLLCLFSFNGPSARPSQNNQPLRRHLELSKRRGAAPLKQQRQVRASRATEGNHSLSVIVRNRSDRMADQTGCPDPGPTV